MNLRNFFTHKIKNKYRLTLKIANIDISVTSLYPTNKILFGKSYQDFLSSSKRPEVIIHTYYGKIPKLALLDKYLLLGIDKMWGLYAINGKKVFISMPIRYKKGTFPILVKGNINDNKDIFHFESRRNYNFKSIKTRLPQPYRVAIFKSNFEKATVYINSKISSRLLPNPLSFPLLEFILPNLLLSRQGIVFHACGIVDGSHSYLFVGHSGSGKSTMAGLWQDEGVIIHDDFIPVRKVNESYSAFVMPGYNTKLKGEFLQGVPISKIFFIYHSPQNKISQKFGIQASTMLLLRSVPQVFDLSIIKNLQNFCMQLTQKIPCYSLGFVPNKRVLDFIRKIK